jgi:hypothetical protein
MIGAGALWLSLDPGGEIIDGARGIAPECVDPSPDFVSDGGSRIDVDRSADVGKGVFIVGVAQEHVRAQRISKGASRIDLDPAAEIGDGTAKVVLAFKRHAAHVVAVKAATGLDLGRLAEVGIGEPQLVFFPCRTPREMRPSALFGSSSTALVVWVIAPSRSPLWPRAMPRSKWAAAMFGSMSRALLASAIAWSSSSLLP